MTTEDPQASGAPETGEAPPAEPAPTLEQERDQFKALAQRTQADFVNFKRRTEDERAAAARNASGRVLVRLLPVVDDMRRAVASVPAEAPATWTDGVKMVLQNLASLLEAEGVTMVEPAPGIGHKLGIRPHHQADDGIKQRHQRTDAERDPVEKRQEFQCRSP